MNNQVRCILNVKVAKCVHKLYFNCVLFFFLINSFVGTYLKIFLVYRIKINTIIFLSFVK